MCREVGFVTCVRRALYEARSCLANRLAPSRSSFSVSDAPMLAQRDRRLGSADRISAREPLKLVAQLGAGGELDFVAACRKRLDALGSFGVSGSSLAGNNQR